MNEYLLTKLKKLSNVTVKQLQLHITSDQISPSPITVRRTRGPRIKNESGKRQKLKSQLKDI